MGESRIIYVGAMPPAKMQSSYGGKLQLGVTVYALEKGNHSGGRHFNVGEALQNWHVKPKVCCPS